MTDSQLFASPPLIALSPGEANRLTARRRADRDRQRRCRARKKWRAQLINAPIEQQARIERRRQTIQATKAQWTMEQTMRWYRAQNVALGALMFGGEPARRAVELIDARAIFDERFAAIWEAMSALHRRGSLINERTVRAQLKRTRVLVLMDLDWLSGENMPRPDVAELEAAAGLLFAVTSEEIVSLSRAA